MFSLTWRILSLCLLSVAAVNTTCVDLSTKCERNHQRKQELLKDFCDRKFPKRKCQRYCGKCDPITEAPTTPAPATPAPPTPAPPTPAPTTPAPPTPAPPTLAPPTPAPPTPAPPTPAPTTPAPTTPVASEIAFESSSCHFIPKLTEEIEMRCGLVEDDVTNTNIPQHKQVDHVLSIVIHRNTNTYISSITEDQGVRVSSSLNNVHAVGDISGTNGNQSYLSLKLKWPSFNDVLTNFTCTISTISRDGLPYTLTKSLTLEKTVPNFGDIGDLVIKQRGQIRELSAKLKALASNITHIETGTVDCGGVTGWSEGTHGNKTRTDTFSRPYTNAPIAFVSVTGFRSRYFNMIVNFWAKSETVNTTHIEVLCQNEIIDSEVRYLGVRWITFPQ